MGSYSYSIKIFENVMAIYRDLEFKTEHPCFRNTVEWIVYLRERIFLETETMNFAPKDILVALSQS